MSEIESPTYSSMLELGVSMSKQEQSNTRVFFPRFSSAQTVMHPFATLLCWWQCWLLTAVKSRIDLSASLIGRAHPLPSKIFLNSQIIQPETALASTTWLSQLPCVESWLVTYSRPVLGLQSASSQYVCRPAWVPLHYISGFLVSCSHLASLQAYTSQTL